MKSVTNAARQKKINFEKDKIRAEKAELKRKLAEKFGDKFKAVKKSDDTVVLSKEALKKAEESKELVAIKSDNPNSEDTKDRIKHLMDTKEFPFSEKERAALEEILG
jgi:hypothetical protein